MSKRYHPLCVHAHPPYVSPNNSSRACRSRSRSRSRSDSRGKRRDREERDGRRSSRWGNADDSRRRDRDRSADRSRERGGGDRRGRRGDDDGDAGRGSRRDNSRDRHDYRGRRGEDDDRYNLRFQYFTSAVKTFSIHDINLLRFQYATFCSWTRMGEPRPYFLAEDRALR